MIAQASESDLPDLMAIEHQAFQRDQFSEALYLSFLAEPETDVYLLRADKRAAGSLVLNFEEEKTNCRIVSIAISREFQGRGFGKKLMSFAEERARAKQSHQISLEVKASNTRAITLYQSLAYFEDKLLRDYYGPGSHAILFTKEL